MKKFRKVISLISVLLYSGILVGCWDFKELDDLSVPIIESFDLVLEDEKKYPEDKYLVTIGMPVFFEDVEKKFNIVETTGKIIGEARGRRNPKLGEQVILGQLQILLIGDELGKKVNLLEMTDGITRNTSVKASIYVVVVKGRAIDIIKKQINDYPNVGIYLKTLLENSKNVNFYPYTTLFDLNRELISYETAVLMPHIVYKEGIIALAGSCLVNKGMIVGELGREETETAVMLRGIKCGGTLSFDAIEDGKVTDVITFEGTNSRKVTLKRTGDKYVINIKIILAGTILEHKEPKPMLDNTDLVKNYQGSLEQHIKRRAEAFVEKTQEEFKFDTLNLANYIKAHTREKLTKEDIDRIIRESEINVDVKVHIRSSGGKI